MFTFKRFYFSWTNGHHRNCGFTFSIGVLFTSMYEATRSANEIQKINDLFAFARNQAVNYGATVTVCPYAATPCGNDWSKGFSVYIENSGAKSLKGKLMDLTRKTRSPLAALQIKQ